MKKYRIRLINPIFGVPVTFIEHYVPPLADRGGIGSEYTDSEKERMIKTSELTDDTIICDTLSPLAYNKNLRSRERERESTSAEYLFRLIGHEHDLGDGTNLGQFEVNGEGKYKRILLYREV